MLVGRELEYIGEAVANGTIAGGGIFMRRCESWLEKQLGAQKVLLTHSCTAALEMAALLAEVGAGDEVIMPSFTFSSTATAFVLRGATPVFVDIDPDTLNIDPQRVRAAVTARTKAIVPVHYAGLACDMDALMGLADQHGLIVIEDAAQAHLSQHRGRSLGTIGHLGCLSFHETKNIISGEGGALIINDPSLFGRAEILREKGTDRSKFLRGEVDKYTWIDIGSSYIPGEIVSAFLYAQLENADWICVRRQQLFDRYRRGLAQIAAAGLIRLPPVDGSQTNGHIFWLLTAEPSARDGLLQHLRENAIHAVFHYVPLHSAPAGRRFARTSGPMPVTDRVSASLIRLPMHLGLTDDDVDRMVASVVAYFGRTA
jgi:dTDP-4-amino-4,6-dideoxygalactose transaminase